MARSTQLEAVKAEWGENEKTFAGIISCPGLGRGDWWARDESEKLKPCDAPSVTHHSRDKNGGGKKEICKGSLISR